MLTLNFTKKGHNLIDHLKREGTVLVKRVQGFINKRWCRCRWEEGGDDSEWNCIKRFIHRDRNWIQSGTFQGEGRVRLWSSGVRT